MGKIREAKKAALKKAAEEAAKAAKEAAKKKEADKWATKKGKPYLDELINIYYVSAKGVWKNNSAQMFKRFFVDNEMPTKPDELSEPIWNTILGLFILEEKFIDRESECNLIAQKAKKHLRK